MPRRGPRKRTLKDNPNHPFPPSDRDLRPDELRVGPPSIAECIADPRKIDELNVFQLNQLAGLTRALLQMADTRKAIPPNVVDFAIQYSDGAFKDTLHLRKLGEWLHWSEQPDGPNLCVSLPPGMGKTTTLGDWYPFKYLAQHPKDRVAYVSHDFDLAARSGRRVRNRIRNMGADFGLHLDESSRAASRFDLKTGGGMETIGTGGGIVGRRFNRIVIDDPVRGADMVRSQVQRDSQWEWFMGDVLNRLEPEGKIIVVGARWHMDDLIGRVMELSRRATDTVPFEYYVVPAQAEDDDILGRQAGQWLWTEKFPESWWLTQKATYSVTPHFWGALYQQNPVPLEGAAVDRSWWQFFREQPSDFDVVIDSWDLTFGGLKDPDYVVGLKLGRKGPNVYVLDMLRAHMDFNEQISGIRSFALQAPIAAGKLIERAANGWAAITTLIREVPGIIPIKPVGDKENRLRAVLPYLQGGNVFLPFGAPWTAEIITECAQFPNAKHDDIVDALSQGLSYLLGGYGTRQTTAVEPPITDLRDIAAKQFSQHFQAIMKREEKRLGPRLPSDLGQAYPCDHMLQWME